jgi:hypothetical protein
MKNGTSRKTVASNLRLVLSRMSSQCDRNPGGSMLKALFVMIVLSNEHAARFVQRFQRRAA